MSQALYTAMSGISAPQSQLNVISNNIANINTIGYKAANATFQDIFSTTYTAGNSPTVTSGGKNPMQIGLGVQIGTIARNFNPGTFVSTGRTTDMMLQGNGFFTVMSPEGQLFMTRAGNFSFDANGDMINAQGYKVVGANHLFGTTGSNIPVHIPTHLNSKVSPNADFAGKPLADLNADVKITPGTFTINATRADGTVVPVEVEITDENTMNQIATTINDALAAAGVPGVTINCNDTTGGKLQFVVDPAETTGLEFSSEGATSNFVKVTQLGSAKIDAATNTYSSQVLDYTASVEPITSYDDAASVATRTIAEDGTIECTYSDGGKLTVELNPDDYTFQFKYTTSTGVVIRGNDVNVNPNVAQPENFVMQIANVVNPEGLVASGGNLWQPGPNAGQMVFSVGGAMGLGSIKTGGYEASNVDMSKEFSDMILAQRAIQANSRVFDTASSVMESLAYLGK